jgi:integrase
MILASPTEYITTLTGRAIYGRFVNAMKRAGFEGVRFHDLRHISASDMHAHGIPDRVAAERGGWSGTKTMQDVYQHTFSDDRLKADQIMCDYYEKLLDASQNATQNDENNAKS